MEGIEELAAAQEAARNGTGPAPLEDVEPRTLAEVEATYQKWLYLPDLGGLRIVLAAVAANGLPLDAVWLLLVAPPSSGKTEIVMGCARLPGVHLAAELTVPALLSGSPRKERAAGATGGLLRQLGESGILLHKDFGSRPLDAPGGPLAGTRGAARGLRRLLDAAARRRRWRTLHWEGKAGLIAGCTPTVDRHHAVMSQMGDRFLIYRLAPTTRDKQVRRSLVRGDSAQMREELARAVTGFCRARARSRGPRLRRS